MSTTDKLIAWAAFIGVAYALLHDANPNWFLIAMLLAIAAFWILVAWLFGAGIASAIKLIAWIARD